jgi:hypothetical protein
MTQTPPTPTTPAPTREQLVEHIARAISDDHHRKYGNGYEWDELLDDMRADRLREADAALSALIALIGPAVERLLEDAEFWHDDIQDRALLRLLTPGGQDE